MRQAVLHLSRPGNQTRVILLTVGLGTFFIMGVRGLQVNLLNQFALQIGENTPDMFLVDIQQDQAADMKAFLAERLPRESQPLLIPVLRARVTGKGVNLDEVEDLQGRGRLSREYTITYRGQLESNETLVQGRFPKPRIGIRPARGVDRGGIVERFGIDVGDVMRFDVLGRAIHARVSGIRRVEWREGRSGGFMFVFGAGTFEGAPHWFFAPVRANLPDPAQRGKFTHDLVVRFPNVSVIDLRELLESVRKVFQVVTVAIDVVGSLVILTGGLILVGAVAVTKFQRVYEAAIFKTLGASSRDDCRDADGRIRPAGDDRRGGGFVRRAGPRMGRQPLCARHPMAPGPARESRRYGRDIAAHHDHRRRRERRCPEAQAACGAACRIVKMSSCQWT